MAGGARDDHAVMAVVALTLLVALFVLAVSHETYVFYYPAIVAGAALMWNRSLALLAGVTTTAFGITVLRAEGVSAAADTAIVMVLLGAVDAALAEIDRLPGRHLYFLDDHLFGNPRFAGLRPHGRVGDSAGG